METTSESKAPAEQLAPGATLREGVRVPTAAEAQERRSMDYFMKRFQEEPIVPIGATITVGFLAFGLRALRRGDSLTQSRAMKGRVIAQGVTALAVTFGIYDKMQKKKKPPVTYEDKLVQAQIERATKDVARAGANSH
jgi:hypothetical protein